MNSSEIVVTVMAGNTDKMLQHVMLDAHIMVNPSFQGPRANAMISELREEMKKILLKYFSPSEFVEHNF